jgi:ferredoxin-NADP reductase
LPTAFRDELADYGRRVTIHPQDRYGLLNLAAALGEVPAETLVYCCGPEPLLAAVEARCSDWPAHSLHTERFVPRTAAAGISTVSSGVSRSRSPKLDLDR